MADICCGPTATGNGLGENWDNRFAFNTGSLVRGNTYYLASGTYAARQFTTDESGSTYIYIKKATASAHGSATGAATRTVFAVPGNTERKLAQYHGGAYGNETEWSAICAQGQ